MRALGERPAWLKLDDGRELPSDYNPQPSNNSILHDLNDRALSLASGDFDEDGTADLVSGYRVAGKGLLAIHRGNADAIFANTPEAKQRKADGTFTDAAFLSPAAEFAVDSPPEMIFTGDFDADNHLDVLAASVGRTTLSLLRGDGHGHLLTAEKIELAGSLTAITVGEINRTDALADVAVAIVAASGPQLLMFSGSEGAFKNKPRAERLPDEATAMAIGRLDQGCEGDLVIAAGHELLVMHRPYPQSSQESVDGAHAEVIERRAFAYRIKQVAIGDFIGDDQHQAEIALMREDGGIDLLKTPGTGAKQSATSRAGKATGRQALANWEQETATGEIASATRMLAAKVSIGPVEDLIVITPQSRQVHVVSRAAEDAAKAEGGEGLRTGAEQMATFEAEDEPVAVVAMRLSASALKGLVMLGARKPSHVIVPQAAGTTFTVMNTNDSGVGSLRQAILDANANPGADTIAFNIPGSGLHTIAPTSHLEILDPVTIDGTTQPGFAGSPIIELNGTGAGLGEGLVMVGGNSTVRGLVINRFSSVGIRVSTANNVIEGNFIGTNAAGNAALGNGLSGVSVFLPFNTIGGTTASARNIISGNGTEGVSISFAGSNSVQGNYIGTDVNGTGNLGNGTHGVRIRTGSQNTIGGTVSGAANTIAFNHVDGVRIALSDSNLVQDNVISGNSSNGIVMDSASMNTVQGNFIGTNAAGAAAMGNGASGVMLLDSSNNTIGGTSASARNLISGNGGDGISMTGPLSGGAMNIVQGNDIGTDINGTGNLGNSADGVRVSLSSGNMIGGTASGAGNTMAFNNGAGVNVTSGSGNAILSNSTFSNTGLGIDLGGDGVTANDNCDGDTGPNDLQNFPVLTSAFSSAGTTTITGILNSTVAHGFTIEFFANSACDPSGFGEGQTPLGSTVVFNSGKDCNITFTFTVARDLSAGQFVTATATDITFSTGVSTSEFSQCLAVCTVACPANITQSDDPGQCGAIVPFQPTITGSCGLVSCNPPSGSFFALGTTTVVCSNTAGASCSFTVTVIDTQPPTIVCPANITTVTNQVACPTPECQIVNFPTPTGADNCPGVTVVCTPPSGSCLPIGTSIITCTATDASGNTASCSFTVTGFDVCLQDDSDAGTVLLFNSLTGDYRFCCGGTTFTGRGLVTIKGCILTLQDYPSDRRVLCKIDKSVFRGTASLQSPPGTTVCTITDRDIRDNNCACQ